MLLGTDVVAVSPYLVDNPTPDPPIRGRQPLVVTQAPAGERSISRRKPTRSIPSPKARQSCEGGRQRRLSPLE
jgi:hypothetical protein